MAYNMSNIKYVEYDNEIYIRIGIGTDYIQFNNYYFELVPIAYLNEVLKGTYLYAIKVPIDECKEITDPNKLETIELLYKKISL